MLARSVKWPEDTYCNLEALPSILVTSANPKGETVSKRTLLIASFSVGLTAFSLGVLAAYLTSGFDILVGLVALNLAAAAALTLLLHRHAQVTNSQIKMLVRAQNAQVTDHNRSELALVERLEETERRYIGSFEAERLRAEERHYELLTPETHQPG